MNQSGRYIIYLLIGVGLYFVLKNDGTEDEDILKNVHQVAPYIILVLVVILFMVRAIRKKRGE